MNLTPVQSRNVKTLQDSLNDFHRTNAACSLGRRHRAEGRVEYLPDCIATAGEHVIRSYREGWYGTK